MHRPVRPIKQEFSYSKNSKPIGYIQALASAKRSENNIQWHCCRETE